MKTWFESLQPRERLVIAVGGVVSILILAWSFAWTPLRNATGDLDRAVTEKHGTLTELRRFEAIGVTLPPSAPPSGSLVLVVDQTHRAHGLGGTLARNQPDGENGIRVSFQRVPFTRLLGWLDALQQGHGIFVESANMDSTQQPGLVNATLVLRRT